MNSHFEQIQAVAAAELGVKRCEYCASHFRPAPGVVLCSECLGWEQILGPRREAVKPWKAA